MPKLFKRADPRTARKTLSIFFEEMRKDKNIVLIYIILIPINRTLYIVVLPFLFSLIIQSLILEPHNWQYPSVLLGISITVSILALITARISFSRLFTHQEKMRTTLIKRSMNVLMRHSDQFFANRKVGTLAGDVASFSGSIISFLDTIFLSATGIIVNFVASLIIIGIMSPILLIPLSLVTLTLIAMSIRSVNRRGPLRAERKILTSRLTGTIADILGNQQIVRFFAGGSREINRVMKDRSAIEDILKKEINVVETESNIRQAILFSFQIITIGLCIWLYSSDLVSIAALVFAVTYLGRLTGSLFDLSPVIRNIEQAFLDAANMTEILQEQHEVIDRPHAKQLKVLAGTVVFDNVTFAYNDSTSSSVITGFSLHIQSGERIGLAGHSGGGKTTLSKLILRFADINDGAITIDGQNISEVTQDSLRENIAYVPQEAYLFHRSLRENIAYAQPDVSDDEIWRAVRQANAYEFVSKMPHGLDTVVGERGVKLSGGQRQRIAIARAILKDAPILVLDEATSALDSESEKLIQKSLDELMKNRTSIVIAHRLSTIQKMDRIIVLEEGRISEQGSHDELLKKNGVYAKLWAHQSGGFIEE